MQIEGKKRNMPRKPETIETRREVVRYLAACGGAISSISAGRVSHALREHLGWKDVSRVNHLVQEMEKDDLVETVRTKGEGRRYYYEIRLPGMPPQIRFEDGRPVRIVHEPAPKVEAPEEVQQPPLQPSESPDQDDQNLEEFEVVGYVTEIEPLADGKRFKAILQDGTVLSGFKKRWGSTNKAWTQVNTSHRYAQSYKWKGRINRGVYRGKERTFFNVDYGSKVEEPSVQPAQQPPAQQPPVAPNTPRAAGWVEPLGQLRFAIESHDKRLERLEAMVDSMSGDKQNGAASGEQNGRKNWVQKLRRGGRE